MKLFGNMTDVHEPSYGVSSWKRITIKVLSNWFLSLFCQDFTPEGCGISIDIIFISIDSNFLESAKTEEKGAAKKCW